MFGGPIDLTPFGSVIKAIGILYWVLALGCLAAALAIPKRRTWQAIAVAVVVVLFGYAPVLSILAKQERAKLHQAQKERFEMRCKNAGAKIYKTVENVEGILLLKVRPKRSERELADQMWPGAAFAREKQAEKYIETFLFYEYHARAMGPDGKTIEIPERGNLGIEPTDRPGYRFVDVIEDDGKRYRYRVEFWTELQNETYLVHHYKLHKELTTEPPPRYAVTFEDDVNPEDRKHWVAGSTVKILDTQTNEVLGEYMLYAVEYDRGNTNQRIPWALSYVCGHIRGSSGQTTRHFVDQVLKPAKD